MKKKFQEKAKIKLVRGVSCDFFLCCIFYKVRIFLVFIEVGLTPMFVGDVKAAVAYLNFF